jgi:hypothetical protein
MIPLTLCVGSAKKRASIVPKTFGMWVEAFFALIFVSFSSKEKEKKKKGIMVKLKNKLMSKLHMGVRVGYSFHSFLPYLTTQ